jgi:hypothetical protein
MVAVGDRGRVVEVATDGRARARIGGRLELVSAYRGAPFTCGDAVRVVGHDSSGPVVDVVGTRAEIVRAEGGSDRAGVARRTKLGTSARITTR